MSKLKLVTKYDKPVPRYTSYPTVPFWKGIQESEWNLSVDKCITNFATEEMGLSLYVHVPYCRSLCAFCGCTKMITRDPSRAEPFIHTLLMELELKLQQLSKTNANLQLKELHLGGGTPTWLPAELLGRLLDGILSKFTPSEKDISLELDPRTFTSEHAAIFQQYGVNRVSLGVQDFHAETLRAIKRDQPYELVAKAVQLLNQFAISSINFDLVYGLPYQTKETMQSTIELVLGLKPSRIALYSYAHVPQIKPAQKGVEMHGLPSAADKRDLYEVAREKLLQNGYFEVGMDHFALPDDALYLALQKKTLHRNFMGYTVQNTKLLVGLGPSSLSDSWYAFSQNEKDVDEWHKQVQQKDISPKAGHILSSDDQVRRKIILNLMCNYSSDLEEEKWQSILESDIVKDELVVWNSTQKSLSVTELGKPFIRNICAQFDSHLKTNTNPITFSKGI